MLYSDTGGGHRAAARALTFALMAQSTPCSTGMCDPLIGQGRPLVRRLTSLYPTIIKRARPAWAAIYHGSNSRPAFAALRASFGPQVRGVLLQTIAEADPDVVLSVHPLLNHVAWTAMQRSGRPRGLMTVVTDLVQLHRGWAFPPADVVVVPTEEAQRYVTRARVAARKVRLLGFPVDMRFRPPHPGEQAAMRKELGLDPGRPTVVVMGGGEGSGRMSEQIGALARRDRPWQVIAVCGRNERLRRRLTARSFPTPVLVLGFVDTMPNLLRATDLVVTKAGPGAIAESLATGLPVILTGYLPGQETPNVDYVTQHGVGLYAPHAGQLLRAVQELLGGDQAQLQEMARRAREITRPHAALDIAGECLRLAGSYMTAPPASQ
ncbi:MAG: MGDG synthase family glycosyltransferase [Candidatus Dormibacter sp.]|uniref:MGDG synthase family glycosyltransferase n=1 Tax=Candidatus Dormibacter sp. TaxID=2973982 RepID=UPI000DB14531|nr:MAG: hypothetical protein DLM66_04635 [Candidatus Dormibacteraeota bacterium]